MINEIIIQSWNRYRILDVTSLKFSTCFHLFQVLCLFIGNMKINRYFIEKKNGTYQFTLCNVTYVYRFIILLIILCCVALCVYHWISRKQNKDEPPISPGCLPFIGHAYLLLGDSVSKYIYKYQMIEVPKAQLLLHKCIHLYIILHHR